MDAQTFEIYLVERRVHGYQIEKPYPLSAEGYERAFAFFGTRAAIVVVSNDRNIDYGYALDFAKAIAFATVKTFHVDLTKVSECYVPKRKEK